MTTDTFPDDEEGGEDYEIYHLFGGALATLFDAEEGDSRPADWREQLATSGRVWPPPADGERMVIIGWVTDDDGRLVAVMGVRGMR